MLHDATDNASPIIINTKCILMVKKSKELNGATNVHLPVLTEAYCEYNEDIVLTVTETPEQILEMLK